MPWEFGFEARSPRYGPFLVGFGPVRHKYHIFSWFLAIFGPFLGHIAELPGNKKLFVMRQTRRTCNVECNSLRLAFLSGFRGPFGRKKAVLGHKMRRFGRATPDLAPVPRAAIGEFLVHRLDLARAPPSVRDG